MPTAAGAPLTSAAGGSSSAPANVRRFRRFALAPWPPVPTPAELVQLRALLLRAFGGQPLEPVKRPQTTSRKEQVQHGCHP